MNFSRLLIGSSEEHKGSTECTQYFLNVLYFLSSGIFDKPWNVLSFLLFATWHIPYKRDFSMPLAFFSRFIRKEVITKGSDRDVQDNEGKRQKYRMVLFLQEDSDSTRDHSLSVNKRVRMVGVSLIIVDA